MALYSQVINAASVGATAQTFDNVGTVTLRSDATRVFGFWVLAAANTGIAAEQVHGTVRVSSSDLGVGQMIAAAPPYIGGAPATNVGFSTANAQFVPFNHTAEGKENIVVDYSTALPDPTNGCSVVVACVYEAGEGRFGGDVAQIFPDMAAVAAGFDTVSQATITTTAETKITTDLKVPAWAKEIVGFHFDMEPNLMTAGEEIAGFVRLRSSLKDFGPQEWPFMAGINAALGTPVGKGAEIQQPIDFAAFFPTHGKNETITAYVVLNATITTGHGLTASVYYR